MSQQLRDWQAKREDSDNKWRLVTFVVSVTIAVAAALLGGWAQATFQRDPVVNNYLVMPTPIAAPPAPTVPAENAEIAAETAEIPWIHTLTLPALGVPAAWAEVAAPVVACESGYNPDTVGKAGELGSLQIWPGHFPQMRAMGLDPTLEADRIRFAVWKVEADGGWAAWSCAR